MPFSIALIQRQIEDLQPEFIDRQLVEEMEKLGKRQLLEEVVRWCKLGLWCESPSHQPNIHKVLELLKEGAPIDLPGDSTLRDYLSSIQGSAPTKEDVIDSLEAVSDTTDLGIIKHVLEEKWNKRSTIGKEWAVMWTSSVTSGAKFLYFVEYYTSKIHDKNVLFYIGNSTVVAKILDKIGKLHWVVGGLVLAAFLIEKSQKVSWNNAEALELLTNIVELAKTLVKLKYVLPEEEENLKKAVMLVVQGSTLFVSQIPSEKSFRFLKTSVNSENLKQMSNRLDRIYEDLTLEITEKITKNAKNRVGIGNAQKQVIELLDMTRKDESALVVVIFGLGVLGKPFLTTSVVAMLDLDAYNDVRVQLYDENTKNDLKEMQKVILKDAFPSFHMEAKLGDCQDWRYRLKEAFSCAENKPVFLFIDNALRREDLNELLPEDLSDLPKRSRIFLTTRKLDATDIFQMSGIKRRTLAIRTLQKNYAENLFKKTI